MQIIAIFIFACIAFYKAHQDLVNVLLLIAVVCSILFFLFKNVVLNHLFKYSINNVSKQFVLRNNALHNDYVTVIYTPDEKIVVMDNLTDSKSVKKMFTLTKKQLNVNKAWNRVCRIFDKFTTLDTLVTFYNYDTHVDVIILDSPAPPKVKKEVKITKSNVGPKFVDINEIQVDHFSDNSNVINNKGESFVEMGSIQEQEQYVPKNKEQEVFTNLSDIKEQEKYIPKESADPEFKGLDDVLSLGINKIDVNYATASEISILPGINIIGAKKIVEYRDLNGLFKSEEDFFAVANVKDHFVQKIRSMIIVGKPSENNEEDDFMEGRIIDF